MKTFEQLTKQQREDAIGMAEYELMDHIADGTIELELTNPQAQERLEKILSDARKAESKRLVKLHLMHDKAIRREIQHLAIVAASGSKYDADGNAIMEKVDGKTLELLPSESEG